MFLSKCAAALSEALCFSGGGVAHMHLRAGLTGSHLHLQPSSPLRLLRLHLQTALLGPPQYEVGHLHVVDALGGTGDFLLKLYMYILCIIDVWRAGPWHEAGCLMMMEVQGCTMHEARGLIYTHSF